MATSNFFYQTLVLPPLVIYRSVKAVVWAPVSILLNTILLPFRIIYSLLASLWWILPFGGSHSASNPPTLTEFLLASLFIGLIAGFLLHFISRIIFFLPQYLGSTTRAEDLVPTARQVQKRIREQAKKVHLLQEIKPKPINVKIAEDNKSMSSDYGQRQSNLDRSAPELGNRRTTEWDDMWQQHHFEPPPRSPVSSGTVMSPVASRDGLGVASQTIVEEDSSDDDTDFF